MRDWGTRARMRSFAKSRLGSYRRCSSSAPPLRGRIDSPVPAECIPGTFSMEKNAWPQLQRHCHHVLEQEVSVIASDSIASKSCLGAKPRVENALTGGAPARRSIRRPPKGLG